MLEDIKVGGCLMPLNMEKLPVLKSTFYFKAPETVDARDYCTKTENQGQTSKCAAYTAAQYAENIRWRLNDYPEQIDPNKIYDYAKSIDGYPTSDGTSLDCVAKALLNYKILTGSEANIKIIPKINILDLKFALHKYAVVMLAFNISSGWFSLNSTNNVLSVNDNTPSAGGHAILGCGYNRDGLFIQNSWGTSWGSYGFALIPWKKVNEQFLYGCTITNVLNNLN